MSRKQSRREAECASIAEFTGGSAIPCMATCPKGVEFALAAELRELGASEVQESVAAVYFRADRRTLYYICLWTRIASRVLLLLERGFTESPEDFSARLRRLPWSDWFRSDQCSFAIDFNGSNRFIRDSRYGAQLGKDAIVAHFGTRSLPRPVVDLDRPDVLVYIRLFKQRLSVGLDLVGERLHKRGYRQQGAAAPLRENLAAALLRIAGWPKIAAQGGGFIDPMCGSGTLLIEAAMMAGQMAPGGLPAASQRRWLLTQLNGFDQPLWQQLLAEAIASCKPSAVEPVFLQGFDLSHKALQAAQQNIGACGLPEAIKLKQVAIADLNLTGLPGTGLVLCNPPYGKRLGEGDELPGLYRELGDWLKRDCLGWEAAIFTGNPELGWSTGLRSYRQHHLFNGAIACDLQRFRIVAERFTEGRPAQPKAQATTAITEADLSDSARMLLNRLRKNRKRLKPWLARSGERCYRLYDADLPEYAVAIDIYNGCELEKGKGNAPASEQLYVHLQEYAAPASVDTGVAARRLDESVQVLSVLFGLERDRISVKQRKRQRGVQQYEKQGGQAPDLLVTEGGHQFIVNLQRYLDTGLFLDSRPIRRLIAAQIRGKRFLNLFAYTASATVYAAAAGARSSVSVDLSRTYTRWARQNLEQNGFSLAQHQVVQADCLQWLAGHDRSYDCILLDPPSFSNSNRMESVLDIQRDHCALVQACMRLLAPAGVLFFVTNRQGFRLDAQLEEKYLVENLTQATFDADFRQRANAHYCWKFEQLPD